MDEIADVLIMMASYNGANYLREQLESICTQTYRNWNLVIQDDGSSDDTLSIIKEYCEKDARISLTHNESGRHGPYFNFHELINKCKKKKNFSFYMFSDQDDVWNPDKISCFIKQFDDVSKDKPYLCYADMELIDGYGNKIGSTINELWKIDSVNKYSVFFSHKIFGCNMMINRALFNIAPSVNVHNPKIAILSHDNYFGKFAAIYGEIHYLNQQLMKYRRHENNATAGQSYRPGLGRIFYKLTHLQKLAEGHARLYNQSLITLAILQKTNNLNADQRKMICDIRNVICDGGIKALRYIKNKKIIWGNRVENVSRSFILFLGIYKKYLYKSRDLTDLIN